MHRRLGVGFGAELDGAGAAHDLGAVPKWLQSVGGPGQAQEVEGVGHGVGVQRGKAFKHGALGHEVGS
ncbi:hypothetical protein D3C72_2143250 [compost metagenome]